MALEERRLEVSGQGGRARSGPAMKGYSMRPLSSAEADEDRGEDPGDGDLGDALLQPRSRRRRRSARRCARRCHSALSFGSEQAGRLQVRFERSSPVAAAPSGLRSRGRPLSIEPRSRARQLLGVARDHAYRHAVQARAGPSGSASGRAARGRAGTPPTAGPRPPAWRATRRRRCSGPTGSRRAAGRYRSGAAARMCDSKLLPGRGEEAGEAGLGGRARQSRRRRTRTVSQRGLPCLSTMPSRRVMNVLR